VLEKLTEVESVGYDEILKNELKSISQPLLSTYKLISQRETENLTAGPIKSEKLIDWKFFLDYFITTLQKIIEKVKELYYTFIEVLPEIFDIFIESILKYYSLTQKQLLLSFRQFYYLFELFGLRQIQTRTFNRINAAIQWRICPDNWIDLEFLLEYKNGLLKNTSNEVINSISNLYETVRMIEREEQHTKDFENNLIKILNE